MQYTVPLEKPAQVADMKSKLLTLQSEMERGGLEEVDNFANLIDGLDAANIITDGENDFRLVVRGGGLGGKQYDAEIDLTKSQFDMLFPGGQYYPSTAIQTFNANFLDQMLRTRPKLEANYPTDPVTGLPDYEAAPTWLPDPQTYWTTATDGQYKTSAANAGIVNSQFPNVQLYGISGNLVSAQNPKNTNQFRLFLNITDPTKPGEIFENILLNPPGSMTGGIIDKSKVAFTISQLNDKFIYEMMNPGKQFTREVQMELINGSQEPTTIMKQKLKKAQSGQTVSVLPNLPPMQPGTPTPSFNQSNMQRLYGGYQQPTVPSVPMMNLSPDFQPGVPRVAGNNTLQNFMQNAATPGDYGMGGRIYTEDEMDGSGRYDYFQPTSLGINNEEMAAQNQSWGSKMVNGVAKGLYLVGSTFSTRYNRSSQWCLPVG